MTACSLLVRNMTSLSWFEPVATSVPAASRAVRRSSRMKVDLLVRRSPVLPICLKDLISVRVI